MSTNNDRYVSIFSSVFNLETSCFGPDFLLGVSSEWDSIMHMSLVSAIEQEFDVLLDTEEILRFNSFESGKEILSSHGITF